MDEQLGWADYSWSNEPHTQQAHGDALVDEIAPPIPPFNSEAEEEEYHCEAAVRHYSERVREKLRRHLTASGVPEGWKWQTLRDVTDEYITSLIAPDGTAVYVGDDDKAVAWLERLLSASGGVPYVPDSLRALPSEWRACVDQHSAYLSEVAANQRGVYRKCAEELERALASAPAVHPYYPRATMDELRKVYSIALRYIDRLNDPVSEAEFNLDAAQMSDELEDAIAAAPTDGRK